MKPEPLVRTSYAVERLEEQSKKWHRLASDESLTYILASIDYCRLFKPNRQHRLVRITEEVIEVGLLGEVST